MGGVAPHSYNRLQPLPCLGGGWGGGSFQLSCITAALHSSPTHGFYNSLGRIPTVNFIPSQKAVRDRGQNKKCNQGNKKNGYL